METNTPLLPRPSGEQVHPDDRDEVAARVSGPSRFRRRVVQVLLPVVLAMPVVAAAAAWQLSGADPDAVQGLPQGPVFAAASTPFAELGLPRLDGFGELVAGHTGRPSVINVFASTCVPCRRELPELAQFASDRPDLDVIAVGAEPDRQDAQRFLQQFAPGLSGVSDANAKAVQAWGIVTLPTTVFVDANGREVARVLGPIGEASLKRWTAKWFGPKDTAVHGVS